MMRKYRVISIYLLLVLFSAAGCTKQETPLIRMNGSTTMDPISRKLAAAYQAGKKVRITVDSMGSHSGLDALISGECDIAESSSEVSSEYLEKAAEAGVVLKVFLIAHDHILPIVHPSNPVETISFEQLHDIYTGGTTTWKPITGSSDKIVVTGRDEASGTGDVWKNALALGNKLTSDMVMQKSNSAVLAFVAGNKNSLGYISAAFLNIEVKPLKVEGVPFFQMQKKNAPHPIYRNLYFYVNEKKFSEDARSFMVFVLSAKGQELIGQLGFTPVSKN